MNAKKINENSLSTEQLEVLSQFFDEMIYRSEADVIYKGHVPVAGFLLVEGKMLVGNKKNFQEISNGGVVGLKELLDNKPLNFSVKIAPGSRVFILDRSSVMEVLGDNENAVFSIFEKLVA